ncbi:MAG: SCP2 sterol-binding domain-containing protein [Pseudomonadota bacterium]|nr:MAG: SCP2 sterol-binding domain-containing protein [Pseudomonadota bacterium]
MNETRQAKAVPSAEASMAIVGALESALNTWLRLDPATPTRLAQFSGKVIAMHLRGLELTLYLLPDSQGVQIQSRHDGEADTTISGTPLGLVDMTLGGQGANTLFKGDVSISGDVELGQAFKQILDDMDIDWEEWLSRLTGDVLAHKLGNLVRGLAEWGLESGKTLGRDISEYLEHEGRFVVTRPALEPFLAAVDTLRDDVERLEARIQRLRDVPPAS